MYNNSQLPGPNPSEIKSDMSGNILTSVIRGSQEENRDMEEGSVDGHELSVFR